MKAATSWDVTRVGERFVEHFQERGFQRLEGGSLLNEALPMTFVMSAGLVQFEKLSPIAKVNERYVLIQNCFRHFDISQIGKSAFHLSLFQMPGAFSFGTLDKHVCIASILGLLTQKYNFAPEDLYVTYFSGGEVDGQMIPRDEETADAWYGSGIPKTHVIGLGIESNFWRQSTRMVGLINSRKCGPITEVFYDRGAKVGCGELYCRPGCSCGRFVEILNNLFISLRIDEDSGGIVPLDVPFTETVIGSERTTALLNHFDSVYEIDTVQPLMRQISQFAQVASGEKEISPLHYRVMVDHLRALLFLIHDGAPSPGKGGRSRLMRILIRQLLTSKLLLGIVSPTFFLSVTTTALEIYPHLTRETQQRLLEMLSDEDERFKRTLQHGIRKLERMIAQHGKLRLTGEEILELETSEGIPLHFLIRVLEQKGVSYSLTDYQFAHRKWEDDNSAGKEARS